MHINFVYFLTQLLQTLMSRKDADLQGLGSHVLPLLGRLLHGLAQRFGVMDDSFELRVCQDPEQVVQNEKQLGCQHIAVLYLDRTMKK